MRLCYVLLSATWGMHQYTANLANRMWAGGGAGEGGHGGGATGAGRNEVSVVTTAQAPRDRYGPGVRLLTPIATRSTGFSPGVLRDSVAGIRRVASVLRELSPDVVHFGGPHLWNPLLLRSLRRAGIPTVHTLHDVHPHTGAAYGRLLYLWNGWVRREADHLLVHGARWQREMEEARGPGTGRVTCTPLTHLFLGYEAEQALRSDPPTVTYEPWALFIGRLEAYKGLEVLVEAARRLEGPGGTGRCVVVAGPGRLEAPGQLPANVEVRNGLVGDEEAVDLFRRCGVVVLPYVEASQSALVAAAYFFRKPVIVTRTGALPEYVVEGETGWVVPPGDPTGLAGALGNALGMARQAPSRLAEMGEAGRDWYEEARAAETAALVTMYQRVAGD
jgi:glycosyltransferase involved in cell wall biosynthesis